MKFKLFLISLSFFPLVTIASENPAQKTPSKIGADLKITVNTYTETVSYDTYSQWTSAQTALALDPRYKSEIENTKECPERNRIFCNAFFSQRQAMHLKITSRTNLNEENLKSYLDDLARKTFTEPVNASFNIENGQASAFAAEQDGYRLNIEKSIPLLAEIFSKSPILTEEKNLSLPFETIKPNITAGEVNNLGIVELIGQGKSNFRGSPANRTRNIKVAVARFNGVMIKPGEEFSFVERLGAVDAEHGYFPELVIKQGKTEPEFGGGICQVSTTMFRAAINTGLQITARRNHAYPVSYYNPQGFDAAVYIPKPDMKFINNTPGHILVQPKITGTELVFNFYGTNDGRKVEMEGPIVTESNPDKSMKTIFYQKVTDKDGNVIINDSFRSAYASPYKYPHPGDAMLAAKPANWSNEEWDAYKRAYREVNPPVKKKK